MLATPDSHDPDDAIDVIDAVVVGGGQAALALGFYLRRSALSYIILDAHERAGGSWLETWSSLRAFSPAQWSSLPGWLMPRHDEYPSRDEVIAYLAEYESRYALPVRHGVRVTSVEHADDSLLVTGVAGGAIARWHARAVISATGNTAYVPDVPGRDEFGGVQLHSSHYTSPQPFSGMRVVVVGAGNSAAQIVADLTTPGTGVAHVTWAARRPPRFLPDDVDGRYLFDQATLRYKAQQAGLPPPPPRSLGDIVAVAPIRAARERGDLVAVPMFERLTVHRVVWPEGRETAEDAIVWATGFRPALAHLAPLGVVDAAGRVEVNGPAGTRAVAEPRLWLVGYGNWTGYASATLIGVGRTARATVDDVVSALAVPADEQR